jgi:hypothetical protein
MSAAAKAVQAALLLLGHRLTDEQAEYVAKVAIGAGGGE